MEPRPFIHARLNRSARAFSCLEFTGTFAELGQLTFEDTAHFTLGEIHRMELDEFKRKLQKREDKREAQGKTGSSFFEEQV